MDLKARTHLITARAAGFQHFRVMALTVDLVVVDAVGEVHQQLVAGAAREALGVPHDALHKFGRGHNQIASRDLILALRAMLIVGRILNVGCTRTSKSHMH